MKMRSDYTSKVSMMFNACPVHFEKTCQELLVEHKTIQQNITRFCMTWLKELATDLALNVDDRNAQSVKVAQMLYEQCPEAFEEPLPYI